jgi:hypothetical protein
LIVLRKPYSKPERNERRVARNRNRNDSLLLMLTMLLGFPKWINVMSRDCSVSPEGVG